MLCRRRWTAFVVVFYGFFVSFVNLVSEIEGKENLNRTRSQNDTNSNNPFTIINTIGLAECAIGIIANGLLLIVIIRNPLNNLRRSGWITITNLAMADFLTSVTTIPFCRKPSEVFDRNDKSQLDRKSANAFLYVGYSASFFMLLVFAVERYIAVKYPLQTGSILTKKRVCLSCFLSWLVAIIIGSVNLYELGPYDRKVWISIFCLLEIVVVLLIAIKVFLIKRILLASQGLETRNKRNTQKKDIVITLVILIFVLLITALPYFIGKQIENISYDNAQLPLGQMAIYFPYYYIPIANLNFIVNPFIYAWRLEEYRDAFVEFFTGKFHEGSQIGRSINSNPRLTKKFVEESEL